MHTARHRRVVIALTALAAAPGVLLADRPPVFADRSFEKAVAQTKDTDKILLVDATAVWCPPCKQMDKTTWRDENVVKWIKKNGLAIQFDVDKQRELAQSLEIQAMPTIIAFRRGEEFDRVVGLRDADDLLSWLEGVKRGERAVDVLLKKADQAAHGDSSMSMQERLQLAQTLAQSGENERALKEFVWLWDHMLEHEPAMVGVRGSFMASDMEQLAGRYAPAKQRFAAMRDALKDKLDDPAGAWNNLADWVVLNRVVGDPDRTLAWFERVKDDPDSRPAIKRVSFRLERLLEERGRWKDMALLFDDPLEKLRKDHADLQMRLNMALPEAMKGRQEDFRRMHYRMFREDAAQMYAALLAADREDDAQKVAAEAFKLDDTPEIRMKFVEFAVRADEPRAQHDAWLEQAGKAGATVEGLQRRLHDALDKAKQQDEQP
jgi:thioredoxin 1